MICVLCLSGWRAGGRTAGCQRPPPAEDGGGGAGQGEEGAGGRVRAQSGGRLILTLDTYKSSHALTQIGGAFGVFLVVHVCDLLYNDDHSEAWIIRKDFERFCFFPH